MAGMDPKKIKARLVERGISQVDIARRLNLSPQTVATVINRRGRSYRVEQAIADLLGLPYEILWGDPPASRKHLITPDRPSCQGNNTNVGSSEVKRPANVGRNGSV